MPKLVWDKAGERKYETGVSKGVLFVMSDTLGQYENGVAWNGLINVSVSPTGAEVTNIYADNAIYLGLTSIETLEASIEAYTYPEEFSECNGQSELAEGILIGQQPRKRFGFCFQTKIGNDLNPEAGYKINILYGCLAGPSESAYATVNESPEAMTMSWDITTIPVEVPGFKPTALLVIDSTKVDAAKLALLTAELYGTETKEAQLLTPAEILTLIQ